jgi:hypothetical protein
MSARAILSIALIGALTTGCYTTTLIPPREVLLLGVNGSPPGDRVVHDVNGDEVTIGHNITVNVETTPGLPPGWAQWSATAPRIKSPFAAEVRGPLLLLQTEGDPHVTQVPLAYVQQIRVREFSPPKTVGLSIGATVGAVALFVGVGFLLAATIRPRIE